MKKIYSLFIFCFAIIFACKAQKVEDIYLNLYTDSLKKGVHNYINVDGKFANNKYAPLDNKQIKFSSSYGKWEGNNLIIDSAYKADSVVVTVSVIDNPALSKTKTIYLKKLADNEVLKSEEELLREWNTNPKKKKKG